MHFLSCWLKKNRSNYNLQFIPALTVFYALISLLVLWFDEVYEMLQKITIVCKVYSGIWFYSQPQTKCRESRSWGKSDIFPLYQSFSKWKKKRVTLFPAFKMSVIKTKLEIKWAWYWHSLSESYDPTSIICISLSPEEFSV